jgi:hypothetical protein
MSAEIVWPAWIIGCVLTVLFVALTQRGARRLRLLLDTPTSKARGVFIGQVELAGRAELAVPLCSPLAGCACVWFRYSIQEEWARWETETYTDNKGRQCTRQVRRTGWEQVGAGRAEPAFAVVDETGAVQVRPAGAEVDAERVFAQTVGLGNALYYGKGPAGAIANSTGQRRFEEVALRQGARVFVAGRARERTDAVAPEIASDPEQDLFVISCRGEERLQSQYRWQFWALGVLQLLPLPVAWLVQAGQESGLHQVGPAAGLAAGMAVVWLLGWCWTTFNSLVQLRNRTAQAASLIDVQLKRRADLIPRLVAVVAGLRDHERTVQTQVAALRAQERATPMGVPGDDLKGTAALVQAVVECYPELRSSEAFLALQRELSDTEMRIALARDYHNAIATHMNTRCEIVPDRWVAALAGLRPVPLWEAEGFERAPVAVHCERSE